MACLKGWSLGQPGLWLPKSVCHPYYIVSPLAAACCMHGPCCWCWCRSPSTASQALENQYGAGQLGEFKSLGSRWKNTLKSGCALHANLAASAASAAPLVLIHEISISNFHRNSVWMQMTALIHHILGEDQYSCQTLLSTNGKHLFEVLSYKCWCLHHVCKTIHRYSSTDGAG